MLLNFNSQYLNIMFAAIITFFQHLNIKFSKHAYKKLSKKTNIDKNIQETLYMFHQR